MLVLRASSNHDINPVVSAGIVVVPPFLISKIIFYVYIKGYDLPPQQLISASDAAVVVTQMVVATSVFYQLQQNDNSIGNWLLWSVLGFLGIYLIAPYLIRLVLPM